MSWRDSISAEDVGSVVILGLLLFVVFAAIGAPLIAFSLAVKHFNWSFSTDLGFVLPAGLIIFIFTMAVHSGHMMRFPGWNVTTSLLALFGSIIWLLGLSFQEMSKHPSPPLFSSFATWGQWLSTQNQAVDEGLSSIRAIPAYLLIAYSTVRFFTGLNSMSNNRPRMLRNRDGIKAHRAAQSAHELSGRQGSVGYAGTDYGYSGGGYSSPPTIRSGPRAAASRPGRTGLDYVTGATIYDSRDVASGPQPRSHIGSDGTQRDYRDRADAQFGGGSEGGKWVQRGSDAHHEKGTPLSSGGGGTDRIIDKDGSVWTPGIFGKADAKYEGKIDDHGTIRNFWGEKVGDVKKDDR